MTERKHIALWRSSFAKSKNSLDGKRRRAALAIVLSFGLLSVIWWNGSLASAASPTPLPDNRAYEQVSPVDKEGSDVEPGRAIAAVDGNRLSFMSRGSFAGQPTALAAETSPYLSTRGPNGWSTAGAALPDGQLTYGSEVYQGFTADMSQGILVWLDNLRFPPHDPAAKQGFNQYMRDSATGAFQLVNGTLSAMQNNEGFVWGSKDFGMMGLVSHYRLTADSPCTNSGSFCAYESEHGIVRLASVLPNGEPVKGAVGSVSSETQAFTCNFEHAVSDDGSRLFFTTLFGKRDLYARENGTSTSLLSGSERTLPGGATGNNANYQSAEAAHGDKVLFTTKNSLVDEDTDTTNDLYMYDFTKPAGEHLTLVSADHNPEAPEGAAVNGGESGNGQCGGLVGASEDLRRVYFVADNQIVAGAPNTAKPKLYLWDDTGASPQLSYIATLDPSSNLEIGDGRIWEAPAIAVRNLGIPRQARWSRDGRYLAFISTGSLTGFDNEGEEEIYRYDAVMKSLDCVSCSSDGLPAHGDVAFQPFRDQAVNHMPQNVSDSGQVFFETTRGLVLHDSNGQRDVYEYDGQPHLISAGSGAGESVFFDATPSGSDVFFATRDRLVGWDIDGNTDVYDARVGGGFPEPGFIPPACEGEACLSPPMAPNDPAPGSSSYNGAGNVKSPSARCPRGKTRKGGKCRKKRAKKHASHAKPSTRSHG